MFAIGGLQSMLEYDRSEPPVRGRASLRNPLRLLVSPEPWLAFLFMLLNLVFGVLWFSLFVTLISTGVGLVITLIGLPILAGTLMLWTYAARFERRRTNAMLGVRIDDPYRPLPEGPAIERLRAHVRDPYVWLDLLYLILLFPIGIIEFVIATVFVSLPIGMITLPAYFQTGDYFVIGNYNVNTWPVAIAVSVLGVLLLLVVPYIFVGIGRGHAWLAQALLGANREAALKARVGQLSESRSRALDAAITDLQRIERDLHDGAQQRLVKLAMDLGMAKEKMKTDPAAAEELITEAHDEAKLAMAEIRDLARGILPAVLTDRGLDAAISALAGRSPIPVTVDVCLSERLPAQIETAAYFVVGEALTNIARHSQATEGHVVVKKIDEKLEIDVVDNGIGGAEENSGTGLAGLRDRLAALDGTLTLSSPKGGPTRLHAEIPCAS